MPRIIEQGTGQLGRAAGQAAFQLTQERERQDRLNSEAQRLALAERGLDLRQQNADRSFDLSRQQLGLQTKQAEQGMRLNENADQRAQQAVGQEDAARQYYASVIESDPERTPEEIEFLRQADPQTLAQQANRTMFNKELREGRMRLESLAGTVAEAMGLEDGDPRVEAMRALIEQSGDSPEAQAEARGTLVQLLQGSAEIQAQTQQRMAAAEQFAPYAQHLMSTLPPSSAGLVGAAFTLYSQGNIEDEEFLGQLQDAVKNARSGTTNRTVGEEFLTSAARSFGTQMGRGDSFSTTSDIKKGLEDARGVASRLDGGAQPTPKQAEDTPESRQTATINGYKALVKDGRERLKKAPTPQQRANQAGEYVQKILDKQGIDPAQNFDLVREMLSDLLSEE